MFYKTSSNDPRNSLQSLVSGSVDQILADQLKRHHEATICRQAVATSPVEHSTLFGGQLSGSKN